jgi:hypothetical protein
MRAVETEIDIAAPPWRVWLVLTDLAAYPAWNPVVTRAEGRAEKGARLHVRIKLPGRSALTLEPIVVVMETGREFRCRSRPLRLPGLLDGEHAYEVERLAEGRATRLRHRVCLIGLLAPLVGFGGVLDTIRRSLEAVDAAVKAQVERAHRETQRAYASASTSRCVP